MKSNFKQPSDFLDERSVWPLVLSYQFDLWCCHIRFNISCKYYDFHLKSYRNLNISRFFQYKYIRNQTGIVVKKVKVNPDSSFVQTW